MPETLYLIDGYAQIFRAYFAIRGGMRSPVTSEPTHAVFGMAGMFFKLFSQFKPSYVAFALDTPGATFRDEMYSEYKGTRNATPDDLSSQIPRVLELIGHFGIPVIGCPGLEADDIIGCITHRILNDSAYADVQIRIVSKDKDLEQLLCDRVAMFDIHTDTTIDVAALLANKGIRPDQVIDVLALMGDTVDNVPGVEGVGLKTAVQLIQEFGSLDGILANLDNIKGKRRENIEKAAAHLPLSRALVTLKCDADFPFALDSARVRPIELNRMISLFQQLGFNRFQEDARRLAGAGEAETAVGDEGTRVRGEDETSNTTPAVSVAGNYRAVTTREDLEEVVASLGTQSMVSVDTETTGLGRDALLCGICLAWTPGEAVYIPVRSPDPASHLDPETALSILRPMLEDPEIPKCGHNLKFDALTLLRAGVHLRGAEFDTMLAATLIDPSQPTHKLDHLAESRLGHRMIPITELIGTGSEQLSMDAVPLEQITDYAAEDADITLRLYHKLAPELDSRGLRSLLEDIEAPLAVVIAEMEFHGILCDPEELLRQGQDLGNRVEDLKRQIYECAGMEFHLDSTKQLAEVLFDKLGLTPGKKTKTGRSTDVEVLEKLAAQEDRSDPRTAVPRLILEYRQLAKLISTYLGNLRASVNPDTRRIHSTFHQLVTATGRLASHGPNLQNIPVRSDVGRQIRKAFHAPDDHVLICADYSQIELRVLAHCSEDSALIAAFENDEDIHTAVASQVYGVPPELVSREQRSNAKTINFGIIYGVTPFGLARRIEGLDVPAATQLIADYKRKFQGIDRFLYECIQRAMDDGYVTTLMGRRRYIPEIRASNMAQRSLGERLAINSVIQGSAADLIKIAMVRVHRRIDRERAPMKLLLQIHDELVLETPARHAKEHAAMVREEMEGAMSLRIPLKAECGIGADWMAAK